MGGVSGTITLRVETIGERVIVEVSDTGKGIKKKTYATFSNQVLPLRAVVGA